MSRSTGRRLGAVKERLQNRLQERQDRCENPATADVERWCRQSLFRLMQLLNSVWKFAYDYEPSASPRWTDIVEWLKANLADTKMMIADGATRLRRHNIRLANFMSSSQQDIFAGQIQETFNRLENMVSRLPPDSRLKDPESVGLHSLSKDLFRLVDGANAFGNAVGFFDRLGIALPPRIANAKVPPQTFGAWKTDLAIMEESLAKFKMQQQQQHGRAKPGHVKSTMSTIEKLEKWIFQARSTTTSNDLNQRWTWEPVRRPLQ